MALDTHIHYSYNDITILPTMISNINHRAECNPFINDQKVLPIYTAPMSTVIDKDNYLLFYENGLIPILPRNIALETRLEIGKKGFWCAYSLKEFIENFIDVEYIVPETKVLIDVANGHMACIYEAVKQAKEKWGNNNIIIMVGNIANPQTYKIAAEAGVDYIRCGIGSGNGCITSSNTAIHNPMATLIDDLKQIKYEIEYDFLVSEKYKSVPKIIADGGIRNYNDVIKALALGADYVMIGSLFSQMIESAGDKFIQEKDGSEFELAKYTCRNYLATLPINELIDKNVFTEFYGMASSKGQISISGKKTKTSEGIRKILPVKYNIKNWTENMISYLQSAMSYTNSFTLQDFKENATCIVISNNTYNSINK